MKKIILCFLTIFSLQAASYVLAEAPLPMPPEPTMKDVSTEADFTKYVKNMMAYLNSLPPYKKGNNINLNGSYADKFEMLISRDSNGSAAITLCNGDKCTSYLGINKSGFCQMTYIVKAITLGPVDAGRKFTLDRLTKMYHYAINHDWPGYEDNEADWRRNKDKSRELELRFGFSASGNGCNAENKAAGCTNFHVQPNNEKDLPCV